MTDAIPDAAVDAAKAALKGWQLPRSILRAVLSAATPHLVAEAQVRLEMEEQKVEAFSQVLAERDTIIEAMLDELKATRSDILPILKASNEAAAEIARLDEAGQRIAEQLRNALSAFDIIKDERDAQIKALAEARAELERLKSTLDAACAHGKFYADQVAALKAQNEAMRAALAEARAQNDTLVKAHAELVVENYNLRAALAQSSGGELGDE